MKNTILIVEDNAALRTGLEIELKKREFEVVSAADGATGLRLAKGMNPDLVLLDIMLPGMSGYEVCQRLREEHVRIPVIVLTAKTGDDDELLSFKLGADDFVRKPFRMDTLVARIQALLQRTQVAPVSAEVSFGRFELDLNAKILRERGRKREIPLTPREYALLEFFVLHGGQVFSREQLLDHVWGMDYEGTDRTVDRFVTVLRQKIERRPKMPEHLKTVRTYGYKFDR